MKTLREQLKAKMLVEGLDECDVVVFVTERGKLIAISELSPCLDYQLEASEIRIYSNYLQWWASMVSSRRQ